MRLTFVLALILTLMLGIIAEWACYDLISYAKAISHGKPLPWMSSLLFEHFGRWGNGGVVALFLIPWGGWGVASLLMRPASSTEASAIRGVWLFAAWAVVEATLFVIFLFSSAVPLLPIYRPRMGEETSISAYVPQGILAALAIVALGVGIARFRKSDRG